MSHKHLVAPSASSAALSSLEGKSLMLDGEGNVLLGDFGMSATCGTFELAMTQCGEGPRADMAVIPVSRASASTCSRECIQKARASAVHEPFSFGHVGGSNFSIS